jgi:transposase
MPAASQRRRRFSLDQKVKILEEATMPGMTVSYVARLHDISPSLIFHWRRRLGNGAKHEERADDGEGLGGAHTRALVARVRDLERILGKMTLETEMLRERLRTAAATVQSPSPPGTDNTES